MLQIAAIQPTGAQFLDWPGILAASGVSQVIHAAERRNDTDFNWNLTYCSKCRDSPEKSDTPVGQRRRLLLL
jgi:hypothetical protein